MSFIVKPFTAEDIDHGIEAICTNIQKRIEGIFDLNIPDVEQKKFFNFSFVDTKSGMRTYYKNNIKKKGEKDSIINMEMPTFLSTYEYDTLRGNEAGLGDLPWYNFPQEKIYKARPGFWPILYDSNTGIRIEMLPLRLKIAQQFSMYFRTKQDQVRAAAILEHYLHFRTGYMLKNILVSYIIPKHCIDFLKILTYGKNSLQLKNDSFFNLFNEYICANNISFEIQQKFTELSNFNPDTHEEEEKTAEDVYMLRRLYNFIHVQFTDSVNMGERNIGNELNTYLINFASTMDFDVPYLYMLTFPRALGITTGITFERETKSGEQFTDYYDGTNPLDTLTKEPEFEFFYKEIELIFGEEDNSLNILDLLSVTKENFAKQYKDIATQDKVLLDLLVYMWLLIRIADSENNDLNLTLEDFYKITRLRLFENSNPINHQMRYNSVNDEVELISYDFADEARTNRITSTVANERNQYISTQVEGIVHKNFDLTFIDIKKERVVYSFTMYVNFSRLSNLIIRDFISNFSNVNDEAFGDFLNAERLNSICIIIDNKIKTLRSAP